MSRRHTHECSTCHERFDCGGTLSQNYDGFPTVWCSAYDAGAPLECEACATAERCAWCGDLAPEAITVNDQPYHPACVPLMEQAYALEMGGKVTA